MPDETTTTLTTETANPLRDGEAVLLVDNAENRYLLTLGRTRQFHSHQGMIKHEEIIGQPEGAVLTTNSGYQLAALRPSLSEYVMKLKRHTQVIYPKDLALILVMADLKPGLRVLESGMGSGALSLTVLRALAGTGELISYEIREEFVEKAVKNIAAFNGPVTNHTIKVQDIYETGIEERGLDRVLLDLPEPWNVVPSAAEALTPGGILFVYLPTVLQVHQTLELLRADQQWCMIEVLESLVRPWHHQDNSIRPEHRMVAHSGFLIFARRAAAPLPYVPARNKRGRRAAAVAAAALAAGNRDALTSDDAEDDDDLPEREADAMVDGETEERSEGE